VLGEYSRHYYKPGEDPTFTAMRNELFAAAKTGLFLSLNIIDQVIIALNDDIENLKRVAKCS
jgi:hypothetical protein